MTSNMTQQQQQQMKDDMDTLAEKVEECKWEKQDVIDEVEACDEKIAGLELELLEMKANLDTLVAVITGDWKRHAAARAVLKKHLEPEYYEMLVEQKGADKDCDGLGIFED